MTQKRVRRRSPSTHSSASSEQAEYRPARERRNPAQPPRERRNLGWSESADVEPLSGNSNSLTSLIEQDAPLKTNTALVLMYGPFQAEMVPENGQGVASWLRDCVRKHGIPSLVRFDYRHRAQVFRRDQFQAWLEPLIRKDAS